MMEKTGRLPQDDDYPVLLRSCPEPFKANLQTGCDADRAAVYVHRTKIYVPEGTHTHDGYELFFALTAPPLLMVEKEKVGLGTEQSIVFNPWQVHGTAFALSGARFVGVNIDRKYFQDTCYHICGRSEVAFENAPFELGSAIPNLINDFLHESAGRQLGCEFVLQSLTNQLIVCLMRQVKHNVPLYSGRLDEDQRKDIGKAIEFLHHNFDRDFSLNDLAGAANFSPYYFARTFKKATGKTPYKYFLEIKIDKARELLKSGRVTITETSYICGFSSPSHFTHVFRRITGMSPSEYCITVTGKNRSGY